MPHKNPPDEPSRAGLARAAAIALTLLSTPAVARDRATGDWGGARTQLVEAGVELGADYTAESFVLDADEEISYLGNIDLTVTLDTERMGVWTGGTIFLYGQHNHGGGLSDKLELLMPVSNLEARPFTQLSEYWLEQQLGEHVVVRLGKQDANRDFAAPRFAGNFVNSSYGVLPGAPLPSFPAPALGAAVLVDATRWLGFRAGVYEGKPDIGSLGESAFHDDAGTFVIGAVVLRHDLREREAGVSSIGGWTHTELDRSGVYGIYDLLIHSSPSGRHDDDGERTVQMFVRGGWSPEEPGEIHSYVGGGVTAHGFLGRRNTVGLGAGHARTDTTEETFVELFYKWRPQPWFTVEPDVQVYEDTRGRHPVVAGLRLKLKL